MEIDFRYPFFAIGFHSGWSENNSSPTMNLSLTRRKKLLLKKEKFKEIKKISLAPPFMVKDKKGSVNALSSGAGSSIIKFGEKYFKIKRNGYREEGFVKKGVPDREFSLENGLFEECDDEDAGLLSLNDALREMQVEEELKKSSFLIPQKIVALYSIKNPFDEENSVAIIQEIQTDFRADEYCSILLTNLFYDVFGKNCQIDLKKSRFKFGRYSLGKALDLFEEKYSSKFFQIGRNIGRIYKSLHLFGYTRGISNSWYGNELICEDGNIGLCDLESCFSEKEIKDKNLFEQLKKTDIMLAKTAFYESMNYFENSLASFVGVRLIEGFEEGYKINKAEKLNPEEIKKQIAKFIKIRNKIIEDD